MSLTSPLISEVCFDCGSSTYGDFVELVFPANYAGTGVDLIYDTGGSQSALGRGIKPAPGACVVLMAAVSTPVRANVQACATCQISNTAARTLLLRPAGASTGDFSVTSTMADVKNSNVAVFRDTPGATPAFAASGTPLLDSRGAAWPCGASATTTTATTTTTTSRPVSSTSTSRPVSSLTTSSVVGPTSTSTMAAAATTTTTMTLAGFTTAPTVATSLFETSSDSLADTSELPSPASTSAPAASAFPVVPVAAGVGGGVGLILLILLIVCCVMRRKRGDEHDLPYSERNDGGGSAIVMTPTVKAEPEVFKGKLAKDLTEADINLTDDPEPDYGYIPQRTQKK